ncbi:MULTISPECIES: hypothetical protein [Mycobacterium]|uniref:hypothetical protein n=1 Tax=Mycobacterium TaxID=1763 RepID=UPI0007054440|nr:MULTISPECIES: hypothetical protein [Mycobacterium]MCV7034825.1 amidohydrolase [Mycobacterium heckeshornense]
MSTIEAGIARRAAAAATAPGLPGTAAATARAWIDTLHARAQIRSERRIRQPRPPHWARRQAVRR